MICAVGAAGEDQGFTVHHVLFCAGEDVLNGRADVSVREFACGVLSEETVWFSVGLVEVDSW